MTSLPGKIRTGSLFPSSSVSNLSRFQTKETHLKSKLVYFGARWYDPSVGRWLSPDPLGDIDGPNRYIYLQNSPVNDLDPWGLCGGPGFFGWVRDWLQRLSEIFTPSAWGSELRRKPVHDVGQGGGGGGGGGGGRQGFTAHARQQMAARGISEASVNEAIAKGVSRPGNVPGRTVYDLGAAQSSSGRGVRVVIENATGDVVTVINKGSNFVPK